MKDINQIKITRIATVLQTLPGNNAIEYEMLREQYEMLCEQPDSLEKFNAIENILLGQLKIIQRVKAALLVRKAKEEAANVRKYEHAENEGRGHEK